MIFKSTSSKAFLESLITPSTTRETSNCDIKNDAKKGNETRQEITSNKKLLRKQMTSIGRFSLSSQTEENPSIISFFVALVHEDGKDMKLEAFRNLWNERIMNKYERFRFHVSDQDSRYFEVRIHCYSSIYSK